MIWSPSPSPNVCFLFRRVLMSLLYVVGSTGRCEGRGSNYSRCAIVQELFERPDISTLLIFDCPLILLLSLPFHLPPLPPLFILDHAKVLLPVSVSFRPPHCRWLHYITQARMLTCPSYRPPCQDQKNCECGTRLLSSDPAPTLPSSDRVWGRLLTISLDIYRNAIGSSRNARRARSRAGGWSVASKLGTLYPSQGPSLYRKGRHALLAGEALSPPIVSEFQLALTKYIHPIPLPKRRKKKVRNGFLDYLGTIMLTACACSSGLAEVHCRATELQAVQEHRHREGLRV